MSNSVFPTLKCSSWQLTRTPTWNTQVQTSASGMRTRVALQGNPVWKWSLKNGVLQSAAAIADLQAIQGFYNAHYGAFDSWLWKDPEDNAVTGQLIATGNGTTTVFQLQRTWGGFTEPVSCVQTGTLTAYVNGVSTSVTTDSQGRITFSSAPGAGTTITATFSFYWRVAFLEDSYDFERIANKIWNGASLSFIQVRN